MRRLLPIQRFQPDWRPAILSALAALAVFAITLKGTYIYDDVAIVVTDPRISHPSRWGQFWTQAYFPNGVDNLYRPLTTMSYAVQWWIHGDRPWAFHLVNWLLYAACAAAVAELARRLAGLRVAYVAGLLFAVHPIHTEVVAEIVGRADLLCTLFFVLALILLARGPLTMRRVWGIFICCVLSLLTKESGLLLPLALLLFGLCRWLGSKGGDTPLPDRSLERQKETGKRRSSPVQILALLLCWFWAGYMTFREWLLPMEWDRSLLDWAINPLIRAKGWSFWLLPIEMLGRYLQLLTAPWKLSMDYGGRVIGWVVHPADPYLYIGLAGVILWLILLIWAFRRRWGNAMFCLMAMALTWGIVSNFGILIGTNFGERLMFLPSVFFLILLAMGLARLPRPVLAPILAAAVILGAMRSVTYARHWNDRLAFYQYSLRHQPQSIRIRLVLAVELLKRGELDQADRVMEVARRQYPQYWDTWSTSFDVAVRQGDVAAASRYLQKAADLVPNPTYLWSRQEALQALKARRAASTAEPTSRQFPAALSAGADAAR